MNELDILSNIDNPRQLEQLYRANRSLFKAECNAIYPKIQGSKVAEFWHERLNYESPEISWGSRRELTLVIVLSLLAGAIAKLPALFHIGEEFFYRRNIGFIVFPVLTIYFAWKKGFSSKVIGVAAVAFILSAFFINLLPKGIKSDTLMLSCIHLPLLIWAILGFSYVGDDVRSLSRRIDFLRYNGDLVIMTAIILIAGGLLTAITIGLFQVIGFRIEKFYMDYIAVFGLAAAPVVATYITQTNPQLVNKVSPVISKIFSPLVLIMLVAYLVAIIVSGKDPYNDREFLLVFNALLIGVMAIILFAVAETFRKSGNRVGSFILLALSVVTIIVNGVAVSAILFRISSWGFTPNRLAVLGGTY